MRVNYYQILGVGPGADARQIKTAHRRLALRYHPDQRLPVEGDSEHADAQFLLITEAYKCLSNPECRAEFDQELQAYLQEKRCHLCAGCGTINRIQRLPVDKEAVCGACHHVLPLTDSERQDINQPRRNGTTRRVLTRLKGEARSIAGEMALAGLRAVVRRIAKDLP
mgnify:CR=1 FL=1